MLKNIPQDIPTKKFLPEQKKESRILLRSKSPLIYLRKTEKDFLIVACVKAAETRLLSQGKIKTLGLIFRHETRFNEATAVLCYYFGSHYPKHPLIASLKTEKDCSPLQK